ncbi:hypothetical protein BLA18112_07116 [Burkholderia lata]|uniref:Lipoprotein n=1 Tax=Burkholderia lata (strain ATCC 17760 / DSM 23089 / LMG 22485 / NCIMB 9086 / R18194 / 383) TaxID=482957 RepID=A0A6P3AQH2_BURL3|nr:hypothetical protein [Burkholderia lata]VWD45815.1 hypothetical protein BLA18112_07116 [Burkholderia lata]
MERILTLGPLLIAIALTGCGKSDERKLSDAVAADMAAKADAVQKDKARSTRRAHIAERLKPLVYDPKAGKYVEQK